MSEKKNPVFIGVAWPYVNGNLHVGHLAGYLLPADILARYYRLAGHPVLMVSGSDCFGTPITIEADKEGVTPKDIVAKHHPRHVELFELARLSYDLYTKTDTDNHRQVTQDIFLALLKNGFVFKAKEEQYFSQEENRFLPDRYVEGTCPHCGAKGARSDQCESCGSPLSQGELVDPVSKITGHAVTLKASEHYFIDWPKLQPFIEEYVAQTSDQWRPWVKLETTKWLEKGLKPRAITRDLDWGIPIPADQIPPDQLIENYDQKRIYVWFDAVIGYFSASLEWATKNPGRKWQEFWHDPSSTHYYFMGKDNLIFHTLFWPGQLHGYDESLHLPDIPVINQFLTFGGDKFSKSRGVIVDSKEIIEKYGVDAVRFYFTAIAPENADTSFTWEDFEAKTNNILIANIGNFINRTLTLAKKADLKQWSEDASDVKKTIETTLKKAITHIKKAEFKDYLETIILLSSHGNKYLAEKEPWFIKDEKEFSQIIGDTVLIVLALSLLLKPVLPTATDKLEKMLEINFTIWPEDTIDHLARLVPDLKISSQEPLFTPISLPKE